MLPESGIIGCDLAWWPDWSTRSCVIIAGGPSAAAADIEQIRLSTCAVIAVNDAHRLAPWADVLYACDAKWWRANPKVRARLGLKISGSPEPELFVSYPTIKRVAIAREGGSYSRQMWLDTKGVIGGGYNSGFQALNLAVQFGCRDVLLIGFDCTVKHGAHWHGEHAPPLTNPSPALCNSWRDVLDAQAGVLAAHGVVVHNASAVSTLQNFQKITVRQWLKDHQ